MLENREEKSFTSQEKGVEVVVNRNQQPQFGLVRCGNLQNNGDQLRLVAYGVTTLEKVIKRAESSHVYESRPAKDVIATAEYYLDNPRSFGEYDVVFNNCESFAFYCKTKNIFNVAGQGPLRYVPVIQHASDVLEGALNRLEKIFN